jgi:hypothetical protein
VLYNPHPEVFEKGLLAFMAELGVKLLRAHFLGKSIYEPKLDLAQVTLVNFVEF